MKKFKLFLIGLCSLIFTSSCETYGQIYYEDYDGINYSTIITYGTPYYYGDVIGYYYYRGLFYYPYLWNNIWYLRPYRTPHPYGWRFVPDSHWRPARRLGDHHRIHPNNYGPGHHDGGRGHRIGNTPNHNTPRGGGVGNRPDNGRSNSNVGQPHTNTHGNRPMGDVRGMNSNRPSSSIGRGGITSSSRATVSQPPVSRGGGMSGSRSSMPSSRGMGGGPSRGGGRGR